MDESRRHAAKFLEKEIKTYLALALFFRKTGIKANVQLGGDKVQLSPFFYRERIKEAEEIVAELKGRARG